jgi:hypothetical protein
MAASTKRRARGLRALLVGTAWILGAASSPALAHADNPGEITLTKSAVVTPAHSVRLAPLLVPLRPITEPPDDGSDSGGFGTPLVVAPTAERAPLSTRQPQSASSDPTIGGRFAGLSSSVVNPADAQVGVGPTDVIEMVNAGVEIWSKTGRSEVTESLGQFFSSSGDDRRLDEMTDPRVLYDTQSGRWFSTVLDLTRLQTVLVVSPTASPGAGSWVYSSSSPGCRDQPRLGMSDTLVAIGDDFFSDCGTNGVLIGGEVTLLDKSQLVSGQSVAEETYGPSFFLRSITPAESLSSTPTLYLAASDFFSNAIDLFSATAVSAASLPFNRIAVQRFLQAPDALQSDPSLIATGNNRIQNAVWENGNLWLAIAEGCTVTGEVGVHACGRFIGVNTATNTLSLQQGFALADNRDAFYPAIMPASDGTPFVVFGYSSASETPGIGVLINPSDPSSTWEIVSAGTGANQSSRWGDYFGIARDPSDGSRIWVAAAYGTGGESWSSTVAAIGAAPFSIAPPTPASPPAKPRAAPPRVKALLSVGTLGLSAHLLYKVWDDPTHLTRERIRLVHLGKTIAAVTSPLGRVTDGQTVYVPWRAPLTAPASLSFCVTSYDSAGRASQPSCAGLRLKHP